MDKNRVLFQISNDDLNDIFKRIFVDYPKDAVIIDKRINFENDLLECKIQSEIYNNGTADYCKYMYYSFCFDTKLLEEKKELINRINELEETIRIMKYNNENEIYRLKQNHSHEITNMVNNNQFNLNSIRDRLGEKLCKKYDI